MKFGLVVAIFQNLVTNDYKSHVVINGLVTFWLISTSGSYISRSNVQWRIKGRRSRRATFCGGIGNAKGCKGGKRCYERTSIHKSAVESIANHKGVDNDKNTTKGDGDAEA